MVMHILERESYPTRFEELCIGLFLEIDQVEYVRTSVTYDFGRDGKSAALRSPKPLICCGTGPDPISKARSDTIRILQGTSPKHLLFCFTDPHFTEHKAIQIEAAVRTLCQTVEIVRSYGGDQLAQLIVRFPKTFQRLYAGELADLQSALAMKSSTNDEIELTGLRIALTTQLSDDAQAFRRDIVRNLILTGLSFGTALGSQAIAKYLSDKLKLPRVVQVGWLQSELNNLAATNCILIEDNRYTITEKGKEELRQRTDRGSISLLDGQQKIKELVYELTGTALSELEFRQVWNVLQDSIVSMFMAHGASVVESIQLIAGGKSTLVDHPTLRDQINAVGNKISLMPGKGARASEIAQAIVDIFHERTSPAFEWLAQICDVFLQLCSLGLEPASQAIMIDRLQEVDLILDTDVVLSLLSAGEQNHAATMSIVEGWRKIGGRLFVSEAVLEEAAHHAWISHKDFDRIGSDLDDMSEAEAHHLAMNAFVRGFYAESKAGGQKCTPRRWQFYINAFRGETDEDFRKILELLNDSGCELINEDGCDAQLAKSIAERLFNEKKDRLGSNAAALKDLSEKAGRDGRLLALLTRYRSDLHVSHRTAFVVSTAGGLRKAASRLADNVGGTDPVIYSAAVAWWLSFVPGVRLSANTLRSVLFDADFRVSFDPLERFTIRVLRKSEEYRIHFSRRGTLRRAMREEVRRQAIQIGTTEDELVHRIVTGDEGTADLAATMIAEAIDKISISQSERKIADMGATIEKLRRQLYDQQKRKG